MTPNGDVVVVELSFDEGEERSHGEKGSSKTATSEWQARSPTGDRLGSAEADERSSPDGDGSCIAQGSRSGNVGVHKAGDTGFLLGKKTY